MISKHLIDIHMKSSLQHPESGEFQDIGFWEANKLLQIKVYPLHLITKMIYDSKLVTSISYCK